MSLDCAAQDIAEDLLYKTGRAILSGDEELFLSCFAVPTIIETKETKSILTSHKALAERFRAQRKFFKSENVADMVRTTVSAQFLDAETIGSTHVCSLLDKNMQTLRVPYPVYSLLKWHRGNQWKITTSVYAILDSEVHNRILSGVSMPLSPETGGQGGDHAGSPDLG